MSFYWILACSLPDIHFTQNVSKIRMPLSEDTQYANKIISWAIMQAGTLFHEAAPFMLGFVFFELCHYFVVPHSYSPDQVY